MAQYTVKEQFREVIEGTRTYTVDAASAEEAWLLVVQNRATLEDVQASTVEHSADMISAFVTRT